MITATRTICRTAAFIATLIAGYFGYATWADYHYKLYTAAYTYRFNMKQLDLLQGAGGASGQHYFYMLPNVPKQANFDAAGCR